MLVLKQSEKDIVIIEINGWLTKNDYDVLNPVLDQKISVYNQVKIFIELKDLDGFTPKAIFEDIKEIKYLKNIKKMAFAGDKEWQKTVTDLADPVIFLGEVRYFPLKEKAKAMEWLNE